MDVIYFLTWISYLVIFIFIFLAFSAEKTDLYCPSPKQRGECKRGNGMAYCKGRGKDTDTTFKLLQKIRLASRYEINSVKWRRSILITFILTLILIPLLYGRLANIYELVVIFVVCYLVVYSFTLFYNDKLSMEAVKIIDENCELVQYKISHLVNEDSGNSDHYFFEDKTSWSYT